MIFILEINISSTRVWVLLVDLLVDLSIQCFIYYVQYKIRNALSSIILVFITLVEKLYVCIANSRNTITQPLKIYIYMFIFSFLVFPLEIFCMLRKWSVRIAIHHQLLDIVMKKHSICCLWKSSIFNCQSFISLLFLTASSILNVHSASSILALRRKLAGNSFDIQAHQSECLVVSFSFYLRNK